MRSCLVLTNGSYFGFICPVISRESQNCRIKNTTIAQIIENRLKENPLGSMKFDLLGICVLKNKMLFNVFYNSLLPTWWGRRTFLGWFSECWDQISDPEHPLLSRWRQWPGMKQRLISSIQSRAKWLQQCTTAVISSPSRLHWEWRDPTFCCQNFQGCQFWREFVFFI